MAVLNPQTVVLLPGGVEESVDAKSLPPGFLLTCQNAQMSKTGLLEKRKGFSVLSTSNISPATPIRSIFSSGPELCAVVGDKLYAYNSVQGFWRRVGFVSPVGGQERAVARGGRSYGQCDVAAFGGRVVYGERSNYNTATQTAAAPYGNYQMGVSAALLTDDGQPQIPSTFLEDTTVGGAVVYPIAVQASFIGQTEAAVLVARGDSSVAVPNASSLDAYHSSFTGGAFVLQANVVAADIYTLFNDFYRRFDSCFLKTGSGVVNAYDWALAYVKHSSQEIIVNQYRNFTLQNTLTIGASGGAGPAAWEYVAICESSTKVYVLAFDGGVNKIFLARVAKSTWTVDVSVVELSAVTNAFNLGCCFYNNVVHTVWTDEVSTAPIEHKITYCAANATCSPTGFLNWLNMQNRSKPYMDASLNYPLFDAITDQVPQFTDLGIGGVASYVDEIPFTTCGVVLSANTIATGGMAAVHDVGMSIPGFRKAAGTYFEVEYESRILGSANNLMLAADGTLRFGTTTSQYSLPGTSTRYGADEVALTLNPPVLTTSVSRGGTVLGGGYLSWFDGHAVFELGFVSAPKIETLTQTNTAGGTLVPANKYRWDAHWEFVDSAGNVHRSSPGIGTPTTTMGAGKVNMELIFRSCVPTMKDYTNVGTQTYRGDNDSGQLLRITEPIRLLKNDVTAYLLPKQVDFGQQQNDIMYTSTGEVEAVIPEGSEIVRALGDRLWVAGSFRGERVLFSKRLFRGSAQAPFAPEMNDTFVFTIPNNTRVTALGQLNDNIVIFTEKSVYLVAGDGPNDDNSGNQFSPLSALSCDGGCIEARSVVTYPDGLFYQSEKGIYHIDRSNNVTYRGTAVQDTLNTFPEITSAVVVPEKNQVRFTCVNATHTNGTIIIYDYRLSQWFGSWNILGLVDAVEANLTPIAACVHNNVYYIATTTGLILYEDESTNYDSATHWPVMKIRFPWVTAADKNGWERVWRILPLLEKVGDTNLKVTIHQDYKIQDADESRTWTRAEIAIFPKLPYLVTNYHVRHQKCTSFAVTVEDAVPTGGSPTGNSFTLTAVRCELGVKKGPVKVALAQRR